MLDEQTKAAIIAQAQNDYFVQKQASVYENNQFLQTGISPEIHKQRELQRIQEMYGPNEGIGQRLSSTAKSKAQRAGVSLGSANNYVRGQVMPARGQMALPGMESMMGAKTVREGSGLVGDIANLTAKGNSSIANKAGVKMLENEGKVLLGLGAAGAAGLGGLGYGAYKGVQGLANALKPAAPVAAPSMLSQLGSHVSTNKGKYGLAAAGLGALGLGAGLYNNKAASDEAEYIYAAVQQGLQQQEKTASDAEAWVETIMDSMSEVALAEEAQLFKQASMMANAYYTQT